jgi:hypothetical protein
LKLFPANIGYFCNLSDSSGGNKELKLKYVESEQLLSQDSHRVNKGLALVSILSQINPVHIPQSYFSKMIFNTILPYTKCGTVQIFGNDYNKSKPDSGRN